MKVKKSKLKEMVREELETQQDAPTEEPEDGQIDQQEPETEVPATPINWITRDQGVDIIRKAGSQIFTVTFLKKDGTIRTMNARRGVTAHLAGGELKYDPYSKGLIPVYDVQKRGYRMINANFLKSIRIKGKKFVVKDQ